MLELLKRRGQCSGEDFDAMGLLQTLCLVKMDNVDGNKRHGAAGKQDRVNMNEGDGAGSPRAAKNSRNHPNSAADNDSKMETEMKGEHRGKGKEMSLCLTVILLLCVKGRLKGRMRHDRKQLVGERV